MNAGRIVVPLVAIALVVGCGSTSKEIDQLRADQKKALDEMRGDLRELDAKLRLLSDNVSDLNDSVFAIQGHPALTFFRAEEKEAEAVEPGPEIATAGDEGEAAEAAPVDLKGADFETLVAELTRMRDQVETLRTQYAADKRLEEMRDPRGTWEALGNQEELTARLDAFSQAYAETIDDPMARDAFLVDVAALREQIAGRAAMTPEEQVAQYKARVTEQLNAETDERRRGWYERQLEMLNSTDEEQVARYIEQASRFENARAVGELAEKHNIPRETLRDNGLMAFGGGRMGGGARPDRNRGGGAQGGGGNRGRRGGGGGGN